MLDKTTAWLDARTIAKSNISDDADFLAAFDAATAAGANICVALDILQIDLPTPTPNAFTIVGDDLCRQWQTAREQERASVIEINYPVANVKEAYLSAFDNETDAGMQYLHKLEVAANLAAARNDLASHFSTLVQLEDKLGNVEDQVDQLATKLENVDDQVNEIENRVQEINDDIRYDLENLDSNLHSLETSVEEIDHRVDALERVGSEDVISDLKERISKLEGIIAALTKALSGT